MNFRPNKNRRFYVTSKRAHTLRRHLLVDILPTILLLLIMALCMSAFARYAESSHFKPLIGTDVLLLKHSG